MIFSTYLVPCKVLPLSAQGLMEKRCQVQDELQPQQLLADHLFSKYKAEAWELYGLTENPVLQSPALAASGQVCPQLQCVRAPCVRWVSCAVFNQLSVQTVERTFFGQ